LVLNVDQDLDFQILGSKPMYNGELPIPPEVTGDKHARELIRVWAAHGKLHVSIATSVWDDPFKWGMMLVDLAKHVANAYHKTSNMPVVTTLERLREGLDAEWEDATDEPTGRILE
jgi:hypothetical protein